MFLLIQLASLALKHPQSQYVWLNLNPKAKYSLRGAGGPELSSVEPHLGNTLGVVGKKKRKHPQFNIFYLVNVKLSYKQENLRGAA